MKRTRAGRRRPTRLPGTPLLGTFRLRSRRDLVAYNKLLKFAQVRHNVASSKAEGPQNHDLVRRELARVLESSAFRGSRRCQQFLRFVVEATLDGRADSIKERNLGIVVFGREPDYDTGDDAIVRVKANDVRKRLAQCYMDPGQNPPVRIELPAGSYLPEFHSPAGAPAQAQPSATPAPRRPRWFRRRLWFAAPLLAAILGLAYWWWPAAPSAIDAFWGPVLRQTRPVVICLGHPVVYLLSRNFHQRHVAEAGIHPEQGPYVLKFTPKEVVGEDLVAVPDQYVGVGSARAAVNFAGWLSRHGQTCELRTGNDISFTDLRNAPAILVGGLNNAWTQELTKHLRYRFDVRSDLTKVLRDNQTGREWVSVIAPDGKTPQDFSIVTRQRYAVTGQVLVSAAGTTQYGTHSASEFLTDPALLQAAFRQAPARWTNCQFVLSTRIVRGSPATPEVIATHFW